MTYVAFVVLTGVVLVVVTTVVLRFVPQGNLVTTTGGFVPDRDDLLRAYVPRAVIALLGVCVVGAILGWVIAGRGARRLGRITDAASQVATGSLSHRVALDGPADDVKRLADTFDAMLARLEEQVQAHRHFAANASHQLRTPHAVTKAVLEMARADPQGVDLVDLLERLTRLNDRAVDLTEALLSLARAESGVLNPGAVDLTLAVDDALDAAAVTVGRDLDVRTCLDPAVVAGDVVLIEQLTNNLVHNAFVHNLPTGGWVSISTSSETDHVTLTVENTGAAMDPTEVPSLTAPFERGGAGRRSDGTGLGLAIAAAVAAAHGTELELTARAQGGLVVRVRFDRGLLATASRLGRGDHDMPEAAPVVGRAGVPGASRLPMVRENQEAPGSRLPY